MDDKIQKMEEALARDKEELEKIEFDIVQRKDSAKTLKEYVIQYNTLKREEKELREKRSTLAKVFEIKRKFFEEATGQFPDSVYPLFKKTS